MFVYKTLRIMNSHVHEYASNSNNLSSQWKQIAFGEGVRFILFFLQIKYSITDTILVGP